MEPTVSIDDALGEAEVVALMRRIARWTSLAALVALPMATWAFFKPVRVLAPTLAGVQCPTERICIDEPARLAEASLLAGEALAFVQAKYGPMRKVPRLVFCSSAACARSFGFTSNAAYNVGTIALVLSPRGWTRYYLRHELIHHVQMERLGPLHAWLFTPTWFLEGMAYSESEDPRRPLPEPLEAYRSKFEAWRANLPAGELWLRAEAL